MADEGPDRLSGIDRLVLQAGSGHLIGRGGGGYGRAVLAALGLPVLSCLGAATTAAAVAMVAQHHRRLHPVRAEDDSLVLRLLSERRDDLAGERTRTANRLHALLRDLIPGGAKRNLSADQAAALLRGVHPVTAADTQRKQLSRELVADLRRLDVEGWRDRRYQLPTSASLTRANASDCTCSTPTRACFQLPP